MNELRMDPESGDDLIVDADTAITVEVPDDGALWAAIARLHPSEALLERLATVEDPAVWDDWPEWLHPVDTGIRLNGKPWGWTISLNDYEMDNDNWFLLPVGFFDEAIELASTSMWQSASMTGAVIPTTCLWSHGVSFGWQIYDEEGLTWRTLVVGDDLERTARDFIASSFDEWNEPVCPVCDDSGWEITIGLADEVRAAVGPAALATIWVPCPDHLEVARVDLDGWWRWDAHAVDAATDTVRRDAAADAAMWRQVSDSITAQIDPDTQPLPHPDPEPPVRGAWVPTLTGPDDDPEPTAVEPADPFEPAAPPTPTLATNDTPADTTPTPPSGARGADGGFDLDGPVLAHPRAFTVTPAAGGGWGPFTVALARLLADATDEGLWWATIALADDTANPAFAHLGPDEGGKLYTEVAGDYYLPEPARLDPTQRAKLRDLGWADPVADLSGDDEIQPRNHTRSWPMAQLADACEHVIGTLQAVYGFTDHDAIAVYLDPFT